jgi:transposase
MNAVRIKQPIGRHRRRGYAFAAAKAYSSKAIRDCLGQHKIESVIRSTSHERKKCSLDREKYRQRNVVERCINWLKEARRIATRYEKMAVNFLAMTKLAIIQRCFRLLDSSDRP